MRRAFSARSAGHAGTMPVLRASGVNIFYWKYEFALDIFHIAHLRLFRKRLLCSAVRLPEAKTPIERTGAHESTSHAVAKLCQVGRSQVGRSAGRRSALFCHEAILFGIKTIFSMTEITSSAFEAAVSTGKPLVLRLRQKPVEFIRFSGAPINLLRA